MTIETDDEVLVTAELPGLEEKGFEIDLTGDVLTLKGEKRVLQEAPCHPARAPSL